MSKNIVLKGVRQNNLKNINVEIPLGSFSVFCGPSGSGKSSLAFQTLFAEGQRRYLESLSNYSRQFVGQAPKPLLDSAKNIPPAIALEQKNSLKSSRSTVGTHTEIYDYIRVLFAKVGTPHCSTHKTPMQKFDPSTASKNIYELLSEKRIYITTPLNAESKNEFIESKKKALESGYFKVLDIDKLESLDLEWLEYEKDKNLFLILDRLIVDADSELRVFDAVAQAYNISKLLHGHSSCHIFSTEGEKLKFKPSISCSLCDEEFWELSPELFSFNNNAGACVECRGFGNTLTLDQHKVIPNMNLSIDKGAVLPFTMPSGKREKTRFLKFAKDKKIPTNVSWKDLTEADQKLLWQGDSARTGVLGYFNHLETKKYKMHVRVFLSRFKSSTKCSVCNGSRLNPKLNQVLIDTKNISDVTNMPLQKLYEWIGHLKFNSSTDKLIKDIKDQLRNRLNFLITIGLPYLPLSRETKTLSGGEFQRTNIAKQLGSELSDTLYVLDEPTIGLHPRDNTRLINLLKNLHQNGNTLVIVEHDRELIENAELIYELGPNSGSRGGEIVFSGSYHKFLKSSKSKTSPFIRGEKSSYQIKEKSVSKNQIELKNCSGHNLKNISVKIPLNQIVCVTGVSGSGKSSLITQTLFPAIVEKLSGEYLSDQLKFESIKFPKGSINDVEFVDQQRLSKTRRSNVATYLKFFDSIRKMMANTKEAKFYGMNAGTFSLNTEGGRCPDCKGNGYQEIEMLFMDNISLLCETCQGLRYTNDTLSVKYNGLNIYEILNLTVDEAFDFFATESSITKPLTVLIELGLGYLKIGQGLDSLSGGESQRLKLSKNMLSTKLNKKLFIFDEPSTGLHFEEIQLLINVFNKLIESGASVIIIEHNLDIIASCDHIIDIGPESGAEGGNIVAEGHPLDLIQSKSYTAKYLKSHIRTEL